MKNTRKKNVVIFIVNNEGKRLWTSNVNNAFRKSIGEAQRYISHTLYNHDANYEVVE